MDIKVTVQDNDTPETFDLAEFLGDSNWFKQAIVDHFELPQEDEDGDEIDLDDIIADHVIDVESDDVPISDMDDAETFLENSFDDEDQATLFALWIEEGYGDLHSFENFKDSYYGEFNSGKDFAEHFAEECGDIPADLPSYIASNICWDDVWYDLSMGDFYELDFNGGVVIFSNN